MQIMLILIKTLFSDYCTIKCTYSRVVRSIRHNYFRAKTCSERVWQTSALFNCINKFRTGGISSSWSSSRSLDRPTPQRHCICSCQPLETGHSTGPWWSDATARADYAMTTTTPLSDHQCHSGQINFLPPPVKYYIGLPRIISVAVYYRL